MSPLIWFVTAAVTLPARAEGPHFTTEANGVRGVALDRAAWAALAKRDPDFRLLEMNEMADEVVSLVEAGDPPPFATIGDFNGDGRPDVILMGVSHGEVRVYGLLSRGEAYDVHFIRRARFDADGVELVLSLVENAGLRPKHEDASIKRFAVDAIQLGRIGVRAALLHFEGGRFVKDSI